MGDAATQDVQSRDFFDVFRQAQNMVNAEYRPFQKEYLIGNKPQEQTFGADVLAPPGQKYRPRNLYQ
ncbi:hypothetical protein LCM27_14970 [Ruegeria marisrubri]|uniref:hypothetical protein n=1 Tax=Ruegeria marisrubri TaxID=1685379 RepID=UPI001CD383CB|nr:hypothetical protein [Ruegeria marisrubri]MCA0907702.1 hypothetical protein [Ruegeria marisrubri]